MQSTHDTHESHTDSAMAFNTPEATAAELAAASFKALAIEFYANPSMDWTGSGGKIGLFTATQWFRGQTMQMIKDLNSGIEDLNRANGNGQITYIGPSRKKAKQERNIALAWYLQEGINKWFKMQTGAERNCKFTITKMTELVGLTFDNMADKVPGLLESDNDAPCSFANELHTQLQQKPSWAKWILSLSGLSYGGGLGEPVPEDPEELTKERDELYQAYSNNSLLERQRGKDVMLSEAALTWSLRSLWTRVQKLNRPEVWCIVILILGGLVIWYTQFQTASVEGTFNGGGGCCCQRCCAARSTFCCAKCAAATTR